MMRSFVMALGAIGLLAGQAVAANDPPLRIVAFGTSLTARGGWQMPLQEALSRCLARPVEVETVALSGSTSDWAVTQIDAVSARRPDIVLVEFSVNDASLQHWLWLSESRRNMTLVFDGLRAALPDARIVDMAMNPVLGLRGWVRPYLGDYVEAHRDLAEERGIGFVDFRPAWNALSEDELDAAIPDGSHPAPAVASAIIVPRLVQALAGSCFGGRDGSSRSEAAAASPAMSPNHQDAAGDDVP